MKRYLFYLTVLVMAAAMHGCAESFEYSPNQTSDGDSKSLLNEKNIQWLYTQPEDDTITIAFVGDSQRFYDELEIFIDTVNAIPSIDFVLLAGDISDFGLLLEFEMITDLFSELNRPYIAVVGNHDVVSKGEEVYEKMFGPLNFSFVYSQVRFVVHNTNGKEYTTGNVPDLAWLRNEVMLGKGEKHVIAVSHVPPFSEDFDPNLVAPYSEFLSETPALLTSLHGHIHEHKDGYPYNDGVRYITSHSFDKRSFVLLKIHAGKIYKTVIDY
jgi:3',5'-cyclic-AMP phosphodiesterase